MREYWERDREPSIENTDAFNEKERFYLKLTKILVLITCFQTFIIFIGVGLMLFIFGVLAMFSDAGSAAMFIIPGGLGLVFIAIVYYVCMWINRLLMRKKKYMVALFLVLSEIILVSVSSYISYSTGKIQFSVMFFFFLAVNLVLNALRIKTVVELINLNEEEKYGRLLG